MEDCMKECQSIIDFLLDRVISATGSHQLKPEPEEVPVVNQFYKNFWSLMEINNAKDIKTNLSLNLKILDTVAEINTLASIHGFLSEQHTKIKHHLSLIEGTTQLRLGMVDAAKESLRSAYRLNDDQLQSKEVDFRKLWATIDALTGCHLCRGEADQVIPMLDEYLKQVEEKSDLIDQKKYIHDLHGYLMKCYNMTGDLFIYLFIYLFIRNNHTNRNYMSPKPNYLYRVHEKINK